MAGKGGGKASHTKPVTIYTHLVSNTVHAQLSQNHKL
jgi:hypothetical protein